VGITNRAGEAPDPTRRSRGELVAEALRSPDARALHQSLRTLPPERHNPFHLLYADERDAFVTWSDGRALTQLELSPGLHIVTERSLGGDNRGRAERLRRLFEASRAASLEQLHALLTIHDEAEPLAGSCIHADALGYGTRSSFIYVSGEKPVASWREGHPCSSPSSDLAPQLSVLFGE
jgi:uncharacterized protein with NRDE domain